MSELTNRIRKHNSWRRGEHDDMCNAMQLGNDLDALSNDLDKLTEQNKLLREALVMIAEQTKNGFTICSECNHQDTTSEHDVLWMAKEALEATK